MFEFLISLNNVINNCMFQYVVFQTKLAIFSPRGESPIFENAGNLKFQFVLTVERLRYTQKR